MRQPVNDCLPFLTEDTLAKVSGVCIVSHTHGVHAWTGQAVDQVEVVSHVQAARFASHVSGRSDQVDNSNPAMLHCLQMPRNTSPSLKLPF